MSVTGINCFVKILTSVIVAYFLDKTFALPRKLSNTEAPDVARNFLRRQKVGLFAENLCAVNQSEGRNSITEMKNLYNVLSAVRHSQSFQFRSLSSLSA